MQVTVGIVTKLDKPNWLNELLSSLNDQTHSDFNICIVTASECSDNFNIKTKCNHPIKVVKTSSASSVGMCRNIILRSADSDIVAFTDDDCIPEPDWLEQGMRGLDENKVSVAGQVLPIRPVKLPKSLYWLISSTPWNMAQQKEVKSGWGSNLFVRRHVALRVGGFDDEFGFGKNRRLMGEEQTLGLRLWASGYKTIFDPKVRVRHRIKWSGDRSIVHRAFLDGYSKAVLIREYGRPAMGAAQAQAQGFMPLLEMVKEGKLGISILFLWTLGFLWGIFKSF